MAIKQYHPAHQDPQYHAKGKSMYQKPSYGPNEGPNEHNFGSGPATGMSSSKPKPKVPSGGGMSANPKETW